ncbi:MAG: protease modulator HflC, partial [Gammaproteobacteria bacterium]
MSSRLNALIFLVLLAVIVISSSVFFVDQRERVLLLRLGQIEDANYKAGIHFKIPFVDEVRRFDGRILTLDARAESYLTGEKKNLLVDSFILWRVADVSVYYTAMGGDINRASSRLFHIVDNGLRDAFATRSVKDVVAGDREQMVSVILDETNESAKEFGIEVVNIRIKRIDFPSDINTRVFERMESERQREAKELRAQGAEAAEKITSGADKQRVIILAESQQKAEEIRGNGDAEATDIYAKAYSQDSEFYAFYRRLLAYK